MLLERFRADPETVLAVGPLAALHRMQRDPPVGDQHIQRGFFAALHCRRQRPRMRSGPVAMRPGAGDPQMHRQRCGNQPAICTAMRDLRHAQAARATWAKPDPNSVNAELVEALPCSSCLAHNRLKKRAILRQAQDSRRWGFKALDYEPGTRWQYSNTGYVAAGMIAEKAGGAPLWQQFEARIFRPLGIKPVPMDGTTGPAFPQGYYRNALGPARPAKPPARGWLWATGEFSMSAAELAKWDIARINRTLLPREDWEEMERPVRLADGTSNGYGLGVYSRIVDGCRMINHGGASVGFLSQNSVWLDDRVAIAVLTNGDFAGAQGRWEQFIVTP
ncbi:MAG: beta-lactamase family protein [Novosphingobium sp.]|nr:beta-lactamase family protein [Novosphingobium sp.]